MQTTFCLVLLFLLPIAASAYEKSSDSGLIFNDTKYKAVDSLEPSIFYGVKTALLIAPDDLPEQRHYSNSSMARVEIMELASGGGAQAHKITEDAAEHVYIVLAGVLEFNVDGDRLLAAKDDVVFIPAGAERSYQVSGGGSAKMLRAVWREKGASPLKGARAYVVSEKTRPLVRTGGKGHLAITPNPRQQVNPLSIIGYGASHINASNSLLLYSADIKGPQAFVANTRFARMGLSEYHSGGGTRWHFHPDREQCFVILSGTGMVEIGANTVEVKPGDILFAPRHVGHAYMATGDEPLKFLELEWGRN
jgi:mannose-6-phosphate isomerase-like protein (cupin superfamily)